MAPTSSPSSSQAMPTFIGTGITVWDQNHATLSFRHDFQVIAWLPVLVFAASVPDWYCYYRYSAVCLFSDLCSGAFCQPSPEFRSATAATAAAAVPTAAAAAAAPTASGAGVGLEPGAQQQPRAESCRQRLRKVGVRLIIYEESRRYFRSIFVRGKNPYCGSDPHYWYFLLLGGRIRIRTSSWIRARIQIEPDYVYYLHLKL